MRKGYIVGRTHCKFCNEPCYPKCNVCRIHYNERQKKYRDKRKRKTRAIRLASRIKHLHDPKQMARDKANIAVFLAIKKCLMIKQPCEVCGKEEAQAHHDSYRKEDRLKIRWLCIIHHSEVHRNSEPIYA